MTHCCVFNSFGQKGGQWFTGKKKKIPFFLYRQFVDQTIDQLIVVLSHLSLMMSEINLTSLC